MTTSMALLSMMRNYGSTLSTSTTTTSRARGSSRSFGSSPSSEAGSFEQVVADATFSSSGGPAAAEDTMIMMTKKSHQSYNAHHHQHDRVGGGKRSKTGFMIIPAAYSFLLVSVVMAITLSALIQPIHANPTCILNCAQCVKIYGDFFDGHACAKICMESRSKFDSFVDCADPTTIARFLKSF